MHLSRKSGVISHSWHSFMPLEYAWFGLKQLSVTIEKTEISIPTISTMPNFSVLFPTHTNLLLHRLRWAHRQAGLWTSTLGPKCWQLVVWRKHLPLHITQVEQLCLPDSNLSFYRDQWELHEERLRINIATLKNLHILILRSLSLTKFHVLWFLWPWCGLSGSTYRLLKAGSNFQKCMVYC